MISQYEILSRTGLAVFARAYAGFTERVQRKSLRESGGLKMRGWMELNRV
jgi:hypothetical protein